MARVALTPKEDDVFAAPAIGTHRRVISVVDRKVVYCRGGNTLISCSLKRFRAWVNKYRAALIHERTPTTTLEQ